VNIFAVYPCPIKSAKYLDNKRLVKMVLETTQLLSTAINLCGGIGPYKTTHKNHPCSIWARTSKENYLWLHSLYCSLNVEYTNRFNKIHKCWQYKDKLLSSSKCIPNGNLTPFPNCTTYKHINDVHEAYRLYLDDKFKNDKYPALCGYNP